MSIAEELRAAIWRSNMPIILERAADYIDALEAQNKALKARFISEHATRGRPTLEEMKLHGAKIGLPDSEAEKCFYYYQSNGWRVGRNPMKCWRSAMINWRKNWQANGMPGRRQPPQQGTILDKEIAAVMKALK